MTTEHSMRKALLKTLEDELLRTVDGPESDRICKEMTNVETWLRNMTTSDGHEVKLGLEVWTSNGLRGTVVRLDMFDGWFDVDEGDGRRSVLNGERVSVSKPNWVR